MEKKSFAVMYLHGSICINFRLNILNCKRNSSKTNLLYEKCTYAGVYILIVSNISLCDNFLHFRYLLKNKFYSIFNWKILFDSLTSLTTSPIRLKDTNM